MTSVFREAGRHERELNERQREILRLIEAGHTNREIADMLGMSVDGAKWNVSEILGKLGLESREQAAEYWRWRHGSVWSRVRGWLGGPLLKVAGAGAAVVGVGLVAIALAGEESDEAEMLVAEWVLEGEFFSYRDGAGTATEPLETADRGTQRWLWIDEWRWRWDVDYESDLPGTFDTSAIADGEFIHYLNHTLKVHYRVRLDTLSDEWREDMAGSAAAPLNRLTYESIDAFVDAQNEGEEVRARGTGSDALLGHPVEMVEIDVGPLGSVTEMMTVRQWIEPTHRLVLQYVMEGPETGQAIRATASRLEFDVAVSGDEFVFSAPAGWCDFGDRLPFPPQGSGLSQEEYVARECGR